MPLRHAAVFSTYYGNHCVYADMQDSDDAGQERWERRSCSFDSTDTISDGADSELRQIRRNTRWYKQEGRFSRGDLEQEHLDRNIQ